MKKEKGIITKTWLEVKKFIEEKQFDKAEETIDVGIALLSKLTLDGYGDKDVIEKVKMEVWKERFWITLENHIWARRPDYKENWKC